MPVGSRFSPTVQTDPGAHPASCKMGTGSFPGVKSSRGVTLTPHPLLVPWSWKGRSTPLLPLSAVRPVQRLSVCTRVHLTLFTFNLVTKIILLGRRNIRGIFSPPCTTQIMPMIITETNSEIIPTRCNNCVYSSQWLYSTCFGWQFHPSSGVQCCIWPFR